MGEFTGGNTPERIASQDGQAKEIEGFKTDVDGVVADGEKDGMPVFNVTKQEFFQNMRNGRKRLRFKAGTPAQQYHSRTRYNRPFWIKNTEDGYIRKIK